MACGKENGTAALYAYRATDPEGDDITWSLDGEDANVFQISDDGILAFRNPPDFETPTDSDRDNVYEVTVQATDEQNNTRNLEVTVTVINVTD